MITPYGCGIAPLFDAFDRGTPAFGPLTQIDCSTIPVKVGGWIDEKHLESGGLMHNKLRGMGKYVKLGVMAARQAIEDAGLDLKTLPPERVGTFISSGTFGHNAEGLFSAFDVSRHSDGSLDLSRMAADGIDCVHPWWLLSTISNNLIFFVTHFFNLRGPNSNVCNSAVGGAYALDRALESLRFGEIDLALVGGADCPLNWQLLSDLSRLEFTAEGAPEAVLPFHPYHPSARGAIFSEGAAFLVLETEALVKQRQSPIYAEVAATACAGQFNDLTRPHPEGRPFRQVLAELLEPANLRPHADSLNIGAAPGSPDSPSSPVSVGFARPAHSINSPNIPNNSHSSDSPVSPGTTGSTLGSNSASVSGSPHILSSSDFPESSGAPGQTRRRAALQINGSAVGIPAWDQSELFALKSFESLPPDVSFSALKALLGHTFSASFILETAIAAACLRRHRALPAFVLPAAAVPRFQQSAADPARPFPAVFSI
jgi:3-oxoacyl-(acyl-carrier-protein) synthase